MPLQCPNLWTYIAYLSYHKMCLFSFVFYILVFTINNIQPSVCSLLRVCPHTPSTWSVSPPTPSSSPPPPPSLPALTYQPNVLFYLVNINWSTLFVLFNGWFLNNKLMVWNGRWGYRMTGFFFHLLAVITKYVNVDNSLLFDCLFICLSKL